MTARTMLLSDEEIHKAAVHYAAPEANHPGKKKELAEYLERDRIEAFEEGAEHTRALYEAERSKLLDEIEKLKSKLKEASGDAAILAHAYSTDNRPPTNVVVRSIERGKRALEHKP